MQSLRTTCCGPPIRGRTELSAGQLRNGAIVDVANRGTRGMIVGEDGEDTGCTQRHEYVPWSFGGRERACFAGTATRTSSTRPTWNSVSSNASFLRAATEEHTVGSVDAVYAGPMVGSIRYPRVPAIVDLLLPVPNAVVLEFMPFRVLG
jgi:hypothetical protein